MPKAPQRYNISQLPRNTLEQIITDYTERASYASEQAAKYKKLSDAYSFYRLGAFGLFILCIAVAISVDQMAVIVVALFALIICFSWLVKKQAGFDKLKEYWLDIKRVNENEIASIQNQGNLYPNGREFIDDKHYYTSDLDVFGENSLYQLLNRAATAQGMAKLAQWLSEPAD